MRPVFWVLQVENLLLSDQGTIKLCDFGSATTISHYPDYSWSAQRRALVEDEVSGGRGGGWSALPASPSGAGPREDRRLTPWPPPPRLVCGPGNTDLEGYLVSPSLISSPECLLRLFFLTVCILYRGKSHVV